MPPNRCLHAAMGLLARREHATAELRLKLSRRFEPEEIESVLVELTEGRYLDDRRFAREYLRQLLNKQPQGEHLLRVKLLKRGLDSALIEESLSELELDEVALARESARLKLASLVGLSREKALRRLLGHLQRQGFPAEIAQSVTLATLEDWRETPTDD